MKELKNFTGDPYFKIVPFQLTKRYEKNPVFQYKILFLNLPGYSLRSIFQSNAAGDSSSLDSG